MTVDSAAEAVQRSAGPASSCDRLPAGSFQSMSVDQTKVEAFAGRLLESLNHAGFCLMASIGHRTGLFDAMRELPPSSSQEIASASNLNERYVREWLGAMVTAGVVEVDATGSRYALPPEHAAMLTRAAGPDNVAMLAQFVPMLASVEDDVIACFRNGGGVPYDKFARFHAVMAEDQTVVSSLESRSVAARARPGRAPGEGHSRTGRGVRLRPGDESAGRALSEQPVCRHGSVGGSDGSRERGVARQAAHQRGV